MTDNMTDRKRCTAVILAAGSGRRMKSNVAKQFMLLGTKPLIWYALNTVEQSEIIDDCIIVTGADDISYVEREIVEKYGFSKVDSVMPGGTERCFSVAGALQRIASGKMRVPNMDGYVFIHDGARPFLTDEILRDTYEAVKKYHACAAAVRSKDTVKIADEEGFVASTPDRRFVWSIQTPQVFDVSLAAYAYQEFIKRQEKSGEEGIIVTDDAGVVELFTDTKVKLVEASYENIKITTPDDIVIAESILRRN